MLTPDRKAQIERAIRELTNALRTGRPELLWRYSEEMRYYLSSFVLENTSPEYIRTYVNDSLQRLFRTSTLMPTQLGVKALELGANPYLLSILEATFFHHEVSYANFFDENIFSTEIREGCQRMWSDEFQKKYEFRFKHFNMELVTYPYSNESFDLVLCCEVLEHLILDPLAIFREILRVLKPGGKLLLTTPNAVRLTNFAHMLNGRNFFDTYHPDYGRIYGRHNREFTIEEIAFILKKYGYKILRLETEDLFDYDIIEISSTTLAGVEKCPLRKSDLERILRSLGAVQANRGDFIYALAEKPL